MSSKLTAIGGDRIGAGGKVEVERKHFERSNHNKGFIVRTTAAPGVVFPFLYEILVPDDDGYINYNAEVLTLPTNGPLFGSFIFDIHTFISAIRNYQGDLQQNLLELGNDMSLAKLPLIAVSTPRYRPNEAENAVQIEPSTLLAHLDFMGLGTYTDTASPGSNMFRQINALGVLTYYDIIKCYFANKQENAAYFIHTPVPTVTKNVTGIVLRDASNTTYAIPQQPTVGAITLAGDNTDKLEITLSSGTQDPANIILTFTTGEQIPANSVFMASSQTGLVVTMTNTNYAYWGKQISNWAYLIDINPVPKKPTLTAFPLKNIDNMRIQLLRNAGAGTPYIITTATNIIPYSDILAFNATDRRTSLQYPLEGLCVKTYQSDLFNNWVNTSWITSVNTRSAVSTVTASFTMDTLNMAMKTYEHLNAIAMAGGTYDDWIEVAWGTQIINRANNPVYLGGLRKEIAFQEVVSTNATQINGVNQPLGQLAGRGVMTKVHKGGTVKVKADEPSILMAVFSITPRIDYSQGNSWINNLKTLDDLHKPIFDQIGFQDLITDQMDYRDTKISVSNALTFMSAGKVPAWINYMTAVNKTRGNFAIPNNQMWMTLNRRYSYTTVGNGGMSDLTTYIDPAKYNYIFAEADISAQNFWVHIGVDFKIRRKMSAKLMPQF